MESPKPRITSKELLERTISNANAVEHPVPLNPEEQQAVEERWSKMQPEMPASMEPEQATEFFTSRVKGASGNVRKALMDKFTQEWRGR